MDAENSDGLGTPAGSDATTGTTTGDPLPDPPPPAGDAPPAPAPIQMTSEQLSDRMTRDRSAFLRKMGVESEEGLTALIERDKAAQDAAEQTKREQRSLAENLQNDLTTRTKERDDALESAEDYRFQNHVSGLCATRGVKNVRYAQFEIAQAAEALPEGQELDAEQWLQERMDPKNEQHGDIRKALGVDPPSQTPVPATTIPEAGGPPTPPPAGGTVQTEDVFGLDATAWRAKQESLGLT